MEASTSEPKTETTPKPADTAAAPSATPTNATPAAPVTLHRPPADTDDDSKASGQTTGKDTAPLLPTPNVPKHQSTGPAGPGGVIAATILVMALLALLTVLVYIKSNNY